MALARIPNQGDYPIDDTLVQLQENTQAARERRDALVRRALSFAPMTLNADLSYKEEKGQTVVVVTPRLGKKALPDPLAAFHASLRTASPALDPVLSLAWELRWKLLSSRLHPADILLAYRDRLATALEKDERQQHEQAFEEMCTRLKNLEGCQPSGPLGGL